MKREWQKALGSVALGLMLTAPLAGCIARPAPRPGPTAAPNPDGAIDGPLSAAVAQTVRSVGGAGTAEAVVIGNVALVAIQLNSDQPGGPEGGPLDGKSHTVDYPGSSPSGGPVHIQGPGNTNATQPARPGGQSQAGGATPGGSPSREQAVPGPTGQNRPDSGTSGLEVPSAGAGGAAPLDVMTRIADMVKAKHPSVADVRFVTRPDDARRLAEIARGVYQGGTGDTTALKDLLGRTITAGTTQFDPMFPPQGTDGRLVAPEPTGTR